MSDAPRLIRLDDEEPRIERKAEPGPIIFPFRADRAPLADARDALIEGILATYRIPAELTHEPPPDPDIMRG